MSVVPLALAIVAAILAVVQLVRSMVADLTAWGLLAVSLALIWGMVHV
jgi:hypothetical protein